MMRCWTLCCPDRKRSPRLRFDVDLGEPSESRASFPPPPRQNLPQSRTTTDVEGIDSEELGKLREYVESIAQGFRGGVRDGERR